jgi:FtsP/CotA-like multicopper oxidase with cupredoxin domain
LFLPPGQREYSQDGVQLGMLDPSHFVTIINGRGKGQNGEAFPLQVYEVASGSRIRMRIVHSGSEFPFYVSVDAHEIDVVASDGYELSPVPVTYITIHPGETMDFEVTADQAVDNYWMRIRTTRDGTGFDVTPDNQTYEGLAIVRYIGAPTTEPVTSDHACTAGNRCNVFNCAFAGFGESYFRDCITFNDVASAKTQAELDSVYGVSDEDYEEVFFTFNFAKGSVVNGKKFIGPSVPLFQDYGDAIVDCGALDCSAGCDCTNIHELPYDKTIQLVLVNKQPNTDIFAHHPIHLHGHGFAVLKVGYPEYNETTGLWTEPNDDVFCEDR